MALQLTSFNKNVYCMPINLFDSYKGLLYIDSPIVLLETTQIKTLDLEMFMSSLKEYTKMCIFPFFPMQWQLLLRVLFTKRIH